MKKPDMSERIAPHHIVRRGQTGPAFLYSLPIGVLGGLIGLGGAEFRLPVLAGPLGYSAHKAVPLNLAVSLTTLAAALIMRSRGLALAPIAPLIPAAVKASGSFAQ